MAGIGSMWQLTDEHRHWRQQPQLECAFGAKQMPAWFTQDRYDERGRRERQH